MASEAITEQRELKSGRRIKPPADYAPVWPYYSFFVVCMGVLHLAVAGLGTWLVVMAHDGPRIGAEPVLVGSTVAVLSAALGAAYCYAPFAPRRPWAWRYHLVLLLLALPTCVFGAVPLLIFWFRADSKRMFSRSAG